MVAPVLDQVREVLDAAAQRVADERVFVRHLNACATRDLTPREIECAMPELDAWLRVMREKPHELRAHTRGVIAIAWLLAHHDDPTNRKDHV